MLSEPLCQEDPDYDVNVDYRLVWEANDNDDRGWFVVGSGEEYRFILDPQNVERGYRVVMIAVA